jgi:glucosamine-6-phosphate deaminase
MKAPKLFAVGDLCVDVLQEIRSGPKFGEEHALRDLDFSIGGNAANFAVVSSRLGLDPLLISAIGRDFSTAFLGKELRSSGVRSSLISSAKENAYSSIEVSRTGERAIQSVKNCLNDITASRVGRALLPKLSEGDFVFFGGFFHLVNLRPGFKGLLEKIKRKRAVVCFDVCFDTGGKWKIGGLLPYIDYLFLNEVELRHITRSGSKNVRAMSLMKKGAGAVVLKQGRKGATLYEHGLDPFASSAVKVKVLDTTGAGDAFNAGYVYGLMRGWSHRNCLLAGNFVASRNIQGHGPVSPSSRSVDKFMSRHNTPSLIIKKDYREMSNAAAMMVARLLKQKPDASIVLPTGNTPKMMYRILGQMCKRRKISFSKARLFQLDEYVGPERKRDGSFSYFLDKYLFSGINESRRNVRLINGAASDLKKECAIHESAVSRRGIDLCILGIAPNGHVGFNEPGSSPNSRTRVVRLRPETVRKNERYFPGIEVPKKGITMGLGTIRNNSSRILIIASGRGKADAVKGSLSSSSLKKWPAASLRSHKNLTFLLDRAAYRR